MKTEDPGKFVGIFPARDGLIVIFLGQDGFVTAKSEKGKISICVWDSKRKAKQAARQQGAKLSELRFVPMTVDQLKSLSKKHGITHFVFNPAFDGSRETNTFFRIETMESIQ